MIDACSRATVRTAIFGFYKSRETYPNLPRPLGEGTIKRLTLSLTGVVPKHHDR